MGQREAKREAWRSRVEAFAASGLTQREWCAREGLALHQLGYWRSQLSARSETAPRAAAWCALGLVPENQGGAPGITVRVGMAGIEVRAGFDATLLREIVRALESVPC